MIYVFLSVCCSVLVGVLIKIAKQRQVNIQQLVLWNYPTTIFLTYILFKPAITPLEWEELPITFYLPLMILLPTLFIFIALAVKYSGIVKTDVAQRMSLFLPLIASYMLFNEVWQVNKVVGICVGLLAVICSVSWNKGKKGEGAQNSIYPILVFFGMGIIDILFKQIALYKNIPYTTSMFLIFVGALIVSIFIMFYKLMIADERLDKRAVYGGLFIGLFNFANIYFYMEAHRAIADNPSIVFTAMNVGVIVLGSLVGVLVFKEKLSMINKIGLLLAIISIFLISYL